MPAKLKNDKSLNLHEANWNNFTQGKKSICFVRGTISTQHFSFCIFSVAKMGF